MSNAVARSGVSVPTGSRLIRTALSAAAGDDSSSVSNVVRPATVLVYEEYFALLTR
jgi:hypothetical protein